MVLVAWGVLAVGSAGQHPVLDEAREPLGQDPPSPQLGVQLLEPVESPGNIANDQERPPLADDTQGLRNRALGIGQLAVLHGKMLVSFISEL